MVSVGGEGTAPVAEKENHRGYRAEGSPLALQKSAVEAEGGALRQEKEEQRAQGKHSSLQEGLSRFNHEGEVAGRGLAALCQCQRT